MLYKILVPFALILTTLSPAYGQAPFPDRYEPPSKFAKTHWWRWDTMRGADFWNDPPPLSDINENDDGTYSVNGEVPVSIALVLHPDFGGTEPWRKAISWVREAERIFRSSGVPVRFIIESIEVDPDMPDTTRTAFSKLYSRASKGADMTVGLIEHIYGDPLCGVANIGRYDYYGGSIKSMSGCNPMTLAHELGHNFGLLHDFNSSSQAGIGYCIRGESGSSDTCSKGTVMAYSRARIPFFSSKDFKYDGEVIGDESADASSFLRRTLTGRGLAWELDQQRGISADEVPLEIEECEL
jgi:hypothetical protein